MRIVLATLVIAACGGSSSKTTTPTNSTDTKPVETKPQITTCEELIARSRKVIDDVVEQGTGKKPTDDMVTMMIEACKAPDAKDDREKLIACVNAASNDDAVRECWFPKPTDEGRDSGPTRKSEAAIYLNKLGKNAKVEWATSAEFPKGKAGVLPPACPCGHKCPVTDAWSKDPIWTALDFQIDEETHYTYTYESDGKTFRATASADLDCDGTRAEYVLTGVGNPNGAEVTLVPPPQGTY